MPAQSRAPGGPGPDWRDADRRRERDRDWERERERERERDRERERERDRERERQRERERERDWERERERERGRSDGRRGGGGVGGGSGGGDRRRDEPPPQQYGRGPPAGQQLPQQQPPPMMQQGFGGAPNFGMQPGPALLQGLAGFPPAQQPLQQQPQLGGMLGQMGVPPLGAQPSWLDPLGSNSLAGMAPAPLGGMNMGMPPMQQQQQGLGMGGMMGVPGLGVGGGMAPLQLPQQPQPPLGMGGLGGGMFPPGPLGAMGAPQIMQQPPPLGMQPQQQQFMGGVGMPGLPQPPQLMQQQPQQGYGGGGVGAGPPLVRASAQAPRPSDALLSPVLHTSCHLDRNPTLCAPLFSPQALASGDLQSLLGALASGIMAVRAQPVPSHIPGLRATHSPLLHSRNFPSPNARSSLRLCCLGVLPQTQGASQNPESARLLDSMVPGQQYKPNQQQFHFHHQQQQQHHGGGPEFPRLGTEFSAEVLRVRHEGVIHAMYQAMPLQCAVTGRRFRTEQARPGLKKEEELRRRSWRLACSANCTELKADSPFLPTLPLRPGVCPFFCVWTGVPDPPGADPVPPAEAGGGGPEQPAVVPGRAAVDDGPLGGRGRRGQLLRRAAAAAARRRGAGRRRRRPGRGAGRERARGRHADGLRAQRCALCLPFPDPRIHARNPPRMVFRAVSHNPRY